MTEAPPAHHLDARVVVYGRPLCHLCEEAEAIVAEVCADVGADWVSVDIDPVPDLLERFTHQVPVTFVDGAQHDFWKVDSDRLRRALARNRSSVT